MRSRAPLAALATALALAGCGGGGTPDLKVSAAASLKSAVTAYAATFDAAHARLSFGGSDVLAAQIRQGARHDRARRRRRCRDGDLLERALPAHAAR